MAEIDRNDHIFFAFCVIETTNTFRKSQVPAGLYILQLSYHTYFKKVIVPDALMLKKVLKDIRVTFKIPAHPRLSDPQSYV